MPKTLTVLMVGLLAVGCATMPTMKSVAGVYEVKDIDGDTVSAVLLENGITEKYENGKLEGKYKWSIVHGEIYVEDDDVTVLKTNKDGSLTAIAEIDKDGKRTDHPKEEQITAKRIK